MQTHERVATRYRCATSMREVLQDLTDLEELDENLNVIEDTFSQHFKIAARLDPEVKNQLQALTKARQGRAKAEEVRYAIKVILESFPDDKTAQRSAKDAEVMLKRFAKHEATAAKIIRTLSKKAMPPKLKKVGAAATKAIKAKLVDPKKLQVLHWQTEDYRGNLVYQIVFRIEDPHFRSRPQVTVAENTGGMAGPTMDVHGDRGSTATGREVADAFLKQLVGWPGMKGEADAAGKRKKAAEGIAAALTGLFRGEDYEPAEISNDLLRIEISYRDYDLPKEGAYDLGEYEYERLLSDVLGQLKPRVERALKPWEKMIKRTRITPEEKSWIYITVELK